MSFVSTSTSIVAPQIRSSGPRSFGRPWASTSRFSRRYAGEEDDQ